MDDRAKNGLIALLGDSVSFDEPMSRHTYFKVGGPADVFAVPPDTATLAALLRLLSREGLTCLVVGGGANLLVGDGGIRGVVVSLSKACGGIALAGRGEGHVRVSAGAGAPLSALCRFAAENGLAGMQFAVGIPGSVGGGLVMNAGTARGAMESVVASIAVMDAEGRSRTLPRETLAFAYRSLAWPDCGPVITGTVLRLRRGDRDGIQAEHRAAAGERRRTQPVNLPSAGCFFRNPPEGLPAGALIEQAGLKGTRVGGAEISTRHANFIVNRGGATAGDILRLSRTVQETVAKRFNVRLTPEVRIVGETNDAEKQV